MQVSETQSHLFAVLVYTVHDLVAEYREGIFFFQAKKTLVLNFQPFETIAFQVSASLSCFFWQFSLVLKLFMQNSRVR